MFLNEVFVQVIANLWAVHNDPENWPEPDKFDPLRHIDENGQFYLSPKVVTFSLGLRRCIGEPLAKSELYIFLVAILQSFDIASDPNASQLPDLKEKTMAGVSVPKDYKIILKTR